jgi:hypothetical protein
MRLRAGKKWCVSWSATKKKYTPCTMHAVSLSNLMDFSFSRNFREIFAKTKIFAKRNFAKIVPFSRKLENAFSFQPYKIRYHWYLDEALSLSVLEPGRWHTEDEREPVGLVTRLDSSRRRSLLPMRSNSERALLKRSWELSVRCTLAFGVAFWNLYLKKIDNPGNE